MRKHKVNKVLQKYKTVKYISKLYCHIKFCANLTILFYQLQCQQNICRELKIYINQSQLSIFQRFEVSEENILLFITTSSQKFLKIILSCFIYNYHISKLNDLMIT